MKMHVNYCGLASVLELMIGCSAVASNTSTH